MRRLRAGKDSDGNAYVDLKFSPQAILRITYVARGNPNSDFLRFQKVKDGRVFRREDDPVLEVPVWSFARGDFVLALAAVVVNGGHISRQIQSAVKSDADSVSMEELEEAVGIEGGQPPPPPKGFEGLVLKDPGPKPREVREDKPPPQPEGMIRKEDDPRK